MFLVGLRCPDCQGSMPPQSGEAAGGGGGVGKPSRSSVPASEVRPTQEANHQRHLHAKGLLNPHGDSPSQGGAPIQQNPVLRKG